MLWTKVAETADIVHVTIGDDIVIDATPNHPFYIEGYGFKPARELQAGDRVRLLDGGNREVISIAAEHLDKPVKVYNFEVEDWHTYYVAGAGVLVHNDKKRCGISEGGTGTLNDGLGNLDWTNMNRKGQTALEHVQKHGTPNYQREMHGVFRGDVQTIIEDAWTNRANAKIVSDGMGGTIYNIPYQNAGYNTGYINFGQQMDYVTIVVQDNSSTVWTAFPSFGDYGMKMSDYYGTGILH